MKPKTVRRAKTEIESLAVRARSIETSRAAKPTGFAANSIILTSCGEKPVSELKAGDRIITRDIGMARLTAAFAVKSDKAFRIRASVLGHGRPQSDLLVAEGQRLLLRDWRAKAIFGEAEALVPVERLVDGHFIARESGENVAFYTLEFAAPHILYVDGVEVASSASILVDA